MNKVKSEGFKNRVAISPQNVIKMERVYTIPLREAFNAPRTKRANKAVRIVKEFLTRHTKASNVKLDSSVNDALWKRSREKPPRRIKIKVTMEEGTATASLVE